MADMSIDMEAIRDHRNRTNAFARHLGLVTTELRDGYARVEGDTAPWMLNPVGSLNGGLLYTAADAASGGAASSLGKAVTTVDGTLRYFRPGIGMKRIIAEATIRKRGKSLIYLDVSVSGVREDGTQTELCAGIFTFMILPASALSGAVAAGYKGLQG